MEEPGMGSEREVQMRAWLWLKKERMGDGVEWKGSSEDLLFAGCW